MLLAPVLNTFNSGSSQLDSCNSSQLWAAQIELEKKKTSSSIWLQCSRNNNPSCYERSRSHVFSNRGEKTGRSFSARQCEKKKRKKEKRKALNDCKILPGFLSPSRTATRISKDEMKHANLSPMAESKTTLKNFNLFSAQTNNISTLASAKNRGRSKETTRAIDSLGCWTAFGQWSAFQVYSLVEGAACQIQIIEKFVAARDNFPRGNSPVRSITPKAVRSVRKSTLLSSQGSCSINFHPWPRCSRRETLW